MTHRTSPAQAAINASYATRRSIAAQLGKPEHGDFSCNVPVRIVNPTTGRTQRATLLVTSNAGFNGITGWFQGRNGQHFTRSLGYITEVAR